MNSKLLYILILCSCSLSAYSKLEDVPHSEILLDVPLTPGYLIYLAKAEIDIWKLLNRLHQSFIAYEGLWNAVNRYLQDFNESSLSLISSKKNTWFKAAEVVKNPISVFRMTRRFVTQLKEVRAQLVTFNQMDIFKTITELFGPAAYPTLDDHKETMESILNLQQFYGIKPLELSDGRILGIQTNISLDAAHTFEIGNVALEAKQYSLALPWFRATEILNRVSNSIPNSRIKEKVESLIEQHDADYDPQLSSGLYFYEEKLSNNISSRTMREVKLKNYFGIRPSGHESYSSEIAYYNVLNICNGKEFVPESVKKTLFCTLDTKRHPYFTINPVKLEILSHDPYAIMMHRAVPKSLFQSLWSQTAAMSVARASVSPALLELNITSLPIMTRAAEDPRDGVSYRIVPAQHKAHFADNQTPKLVERMEILTGLNIFGNASDNLVVNSFLHGPPVGIHCDHLFGLDDGGQWTQGHRLSSIVLYMTDVELGGGTVFPYLGFRTYPEAGSVLYWHAAHTNGEIDFRTSHGGCSAALGLRWISVQFIRQFENFLKQPCSLQQVGDSSVSDMDIHPHLRKVPPLKFHILEFNLYSKRSRALEFKRDEGNKPFKYVVPNREGPVLASKDGTLLELN